MSTINQELLDALQREIGTGKTQIYWHVARKREATGLPRAQAAIALALELGINIARYATEYDLEMIREAEPGLRSLIDRMMPRKMKVSTAVDRALREGNGRLPFLNAKMVNSAHQNAEICARLFMFENSLRLTVYAVMEQEYGLDWWYDNVPREIMYETFDRRSGEKGVQWRRKVGAEPIYYTDIKDLSKIINLHQDVFKRVLGKKLTLDPWVETVEGIRTALATANPVTMKDRKKFAEIFDTWNTVAERIRKNLETKGTKKNG